MSGGKLMQDFDWDMLIEEAAAVAEVQNRRESEAMRGEPMGSRMTARELWTFRRMTGDPDCPWDWDMVGLRAYCDRVGCAVPDPARFEESE